VGIGRIKVSETPISTNKKLGTVVHRCHISYTGSINRRTMVQASPGIMEDLFKKYLKLKGLQTWLKALSSNASTAKKKNKDSSKTFLKVKLE
jgi:hypothetical protein